MNKVGLSYRGPLSSWLSGAPSTLDCIEILAEHFAQAGRGHLRVLGEKYELLVHTERLSLGTPGPLDSGELAALAALVRDVQPPWVSEHLGFRCTQEVELASPVPMLLNLRTLDWVAERVSRVMDACRVPLLLENLSSPLAVRGSLSEPEFLNRLCARIGCGVLLDVTALFVNSRNHGFDPLQWLGDLDAAHIVQVHVGGCRENDGRWEDAHDGPLPDEVWGILGEVLKRGSVRAVVLERDASFPAPAELARELGRIRSLAVHGDGDVVGD